MPKMYEYLNPQAHTIQLSSPEKKIVKIPAKSKVVLPEWYLNYCPKYLRVVREVGEAAPIISPKDLSENKIGYTPPQNRKTRLRPNTKKIQNKIGPNPIPLKVGNRPIRATASRPTETRRTRPRAQIPNKLVDRIKRRRSSPIVGRQVRENSKKLFVEACQSNEWAVSNNVGIGILSYNRLKSLQRLVSSIRRHTDLTKTTVFVSDESSDATVKKWLKQQTDIVVLTDQPRLGIAGNTNRLLRCLSRFKYAMIFNDDVEVLQAGWDTFYVNASLETRYHHFCYHQIGVYGAKRDGKRRKIGKSQIQTWDKRPHGAAIFFTNEAFQKVGYFDEKFGIYGMEHVDWSQRISNTGIQPPGFHDVTGADRFFKIHQEKSAVKNRTQELAKARIVYDKIKYAKRTYIKASDCSEVPTISVVIPVRNIGRQEAIEIAVQSIRSQLFPGVEIIVSEQDQKTNINLNNIKPCRYFFSRNKYKQQPFTKAMAFNLGIANATTNYIVLQDGDIVCSSNYLRKIYNLLQHHAGIHIGAKVLYMSNQSTKDIIKTKKINRAKECERAVGYFEGGSLACTKAAYFKCGGFNEIFEGYGVEDCDFFERLKYHTKFYNIRTEDFIHLWHGRTSGWDQHHRRNKKIGKQLKKQYNMNSYIASLVEKVAKTYPEVAKELGL